MLISLLANSKRMPSDHSTAALATTSLMHGSRMEQEGGNTGHNCNRKEPVKIYTPILYILVYL